MSELSEAINEMRNMRESYDQLAEAAEAYNEGKPALAEAITAKGVEAAATDSLATMAEKVMTISQDTYEIEGGEMYAKQLFGVANNDIAPGYWNLYDILAQLLSDGRLVNYGGILLAEYYKGYDSLALSGAGAGGAYVVSDKDSDGNFIMYTEDTTHTWATEFDGKGNRWVAYCFADEYHDFQITDTNISPRSIFIGRKVGTITCLANTRISQIVVQDGNELKDFSTSSYTANWKQEVVFRNIVRANHVFIAGAGSYEKIYFQAKEIASAFALFNIPKSGSSLSSIIINCEKLATSGTVCLFPNGIGNSLALANLVLTNIEQCTFNFQLSNEYNYWSLSNFKSMSVVESEEFKMYLYFDTANKVANFQKLYFGYKTNDRTKSFIVTGHGGYKDNILDLELKDGWIKPLNVTGLTHLTEENIVNHILNKLGDNTGQPAITITLGSTNLDKLTAEEKEIATNKGFILA